MPYASSTPVRPPARSTPICPHRVGFGAGTRSNCSGAPCVAASLSHTHVHAAAADGVTAADADADAERSVVAAFVRGSGSSGASGLGGWFTLVCRYPAFRGERSLPQMPAGKARPSRPSGAPRGTKLPETSECFRKLPCERPLKRASEADGARERCALQRASAAHRSSETLPRGPCRCRWPRSCSGEPSVRQRYATHGYSKVLTSAPRAPSVRQHCATHGYW